MMRIYPLFGIQFSTSDTLDQLSDYLIQFV